jgi:hypothetical protein
VRSTASVSTPRGRIRSGRSQTVTAILPPGRKTRANSASALSGRGKWLTTNPATTASKLASAKDNRSASPCWNSISGYRPLATATIPTAASNPSGTAPLAAAAAAQ